MTRTKIDPQTLRVNPHEGPQQRESEEKPLRKATETTQRKPEESPQRKPRSLQWKCLSCGFTSPPDGKSYMQAIKHQCTGRRVLVLVDKETGEELATNMGQAQALVLLPKSPKAKPSGKQPKAKQKLETTLLGGETMSGFEDKPEESEENPEEPEEKPEEKKGEKKPKIEGISEDFIEGDAIWVKAQVSVKTIMYYQLAADRVRRNNGSKLTIGDFFDIAVDDYFKGRDQSLELVGGKKEE